MSKQLGVIKLKGNIGGISFYQSEGVHLARLANGPSKERIAGDTAFQRTRENNAEFGGSATAAKALRTALASVLGTMADSRLAARLTQLFKQLNTLGTGTRGQRGITLSTHKPMLVGLEFNSKQSFSSLFSAPFTTVMNVDRNQGTITVAAFMPANFISMPSGATHFRLVQALGTVSDYVYNNLTKAYEPFDPVMNSLGAVTYSAYTPLVAAAPLTLNLVTALAGAPKPGVQISVVQCLGIEFYQQQGGVNYLLAQGNALKVVAVF